MSAILRHRLLRLERDHQSRTLERQAPGGDRRQALIGAYVHGLAGDDITPWRLALDALPPLPPGRPKVREMDATERQHRILALLAREARTDPEYRDLLALAAGAGLASERQKAWMVAEGLIAR